jgi:hypothetical protein
MLFIQVSADELVLQLIVRGEMVIGDIALKHITLGVRED